MHEAVLVHSLDSKIVAFLSTSNHDIIQLNNILIHSVLFNLILIAKYLSAKTVKFTVVYYQNSPTAMTHLQFSPATMLYISFSRVVQMYKVFVSTSQTPQSNAALAVFTYRNGTDA